MFQRKPKPVQLHTFRVSTFGQHGTVTASLPTSTPTALELKKEVCKKLTIRPPALPHFSIFLGPLGAPIKRFEDTETVSQRDTLCMQKWGADIIKEDKARREHFIDMDAIHLQYSEALHYLKTGQLKPTESEREELAEFMDPMFPTETQFLLVARKIEGYVGVTVKDCLLKSPAEHQDVSIPAGTVVECSLTSTHFVIRTADNTTCRWEWSRVKRWSNLQPQPMDSARFEFIMQKQNVGILQWLELATPRAAILLQTAINICAYMHESTMPHEVIAEKLKNTVEGRVVDPLNEYVHNLLFGAGPKFSSAASQDKH